MEATHPDVAATGSSEPPRERGEEAGPSSDPERNCAGSSSTPEIPSPEPNADANAVPEAILPPVAASTGPAPHAEASPRTAPGPEGSRPGPEIFRQRFRQFRYRDAAGPREAFRQLRELSRQWLRPDIRTKEQIVEMLVQEQLLAVLPEAARARRLHRRSDVRITG